MTTTREYIGGDRYQFDFDRCRASKGWAQIDTGQDASYFGTWANPTTRAILSFCEGDLTLTACDTDAEFVAELRRIADWNVEQGWGCAIDGMCNEAIIAAFTRIGVADLLH